MWPAGIVTRILKVTLALSLTQVPVTAFAADAPDSAKESVKWGQNGWPTMPSFVQGDQEWTGGDRAKRPQGPDGSPVRQTGQRDAQGRPMFMSMDAQGNVVEVVPKAQPTGKTFADAVEYRTPNLPGNQPKLVPPTLVDRAVEVIKTPILNAIAPKEFVAPEWGKGGWPSIPDRRLADLRWTGGTNGKSPVSPDGYNPVFFSGLNDAEGRPIVYAKDDRVGKIVEATVAKTPEGKTFAQAIQFTETSLTALAPAGSNLVALDKPSNLRRRLRWTDHNTREMFTAIQEVITGKKAWQDMKRPNLQGSAAKTVQAMSTLPVSALSFGLALGVVSAYTLQRDYPNNPLVWSKYFEQMTDPIGWISLTGFLIGMAPATAYLNSPRAPKTILWQTPIFVGGLVLGTMMQTAIEVFARDEDVSACAGFTNRYKTGSPFDNGRTNPFKPHDYGACDRAFAKFTSGELPAEMIMKAIPSIAAVAISGSIFYGILAKFQSSPTAQRMMTAAGMSKTNLWGAALRGAYVVGTSVLFLAMATKPQDFFADRWDKFTLASFAKDGPLYATTVEKSETDLFQTWESLRKSGWQDPDVLAEVKDVCFDPKRIGPKYFDCAKAKTLDFAGALDTYGALQKKWRQTLLRPTLSAYQEWTQKVAAFRELYKQAFEFYGKAIKSIIYTREHPNAPATDPNVFNEANMEIKTTSPVLTDADRSVVARLDMVESFDRFANVSTPLLQEFLATSMACGPEAEGQTPGAWWHGLRDFGYDQLNIKRTADQVIEDEQGIFFKSKGYKVIFHPPRLTTPLPGTTDTICDKAWSSGWSTKSLPARFFWSVKDWLAPATLNKFEVVSNGTHYRGMLDYIRDHVRTNIVTNTGVNQFESWWSDFLGRQNEALGKSMSDDFQTVINGPFKNVLKNQTYYVCDQNAVVNGTRLERYVGKLRLPTDSCGAQRTSRLANGVMNNMRDQARLYLAMMLDLYVSNSGVLNNGLTSGSGEPRYAKSVDDVENAVLMPAYRVLEAYDAFAVEITDGTDSEKAENAGKKMTEALVKFMGLVAGEGSGPRFGVAAETFKVKHTGKLVTVAERANMPTLMMARLAEGLNGVLQEWQSYMQIAAMQ